MRFSTYLNNKKCMEWQLNAQQGILFSLLYDCSNWAKEVIVDGQTYYFVSRNLVINELPMFFEKGLIKYKKNEKMDLIRITEKGKEWNFSNFENNSEKNPSFEENSEKIPNKLGKKSENNSEKNPTYNNIINIKKIILNNKYIDRSKEFIEAFESYKKMRKSIKKPMTENSVKRMLKKLEKIGNEETAIKMLNQAEDKCWLDVYEVKEGNNGNSNNTRYSRKQEDRHSKKPDYTKGFDDWN